jgi:hypothetical protein
MTLPEFWERDPPQTVSSGWSSYSIQCRNSVVSEIGR